MGIGKRIKEARERAGLTQEELGALVGVTGSAITNYEKGTSHPKEPVLYALINALHVDANYLFQDCVKTLRSSSEISLKERKLLSDFSALDKWGQKQVLSVVSNELARCAEQTQSTPMSDVIYLPYPLQPASAGTGDFADDETAERFPVRRNACTAKADYIMRVHGDSMEPQIKDSDRILVRRQPAYVDGYRSKSDLVARREHGACMLQGIVKCSACGGTLSRASYIYFNCVRYVHGKCSVSHSISISEAEKMILWAMHQQFDALDLTFAPRENTQVQAEKEAILSQIRHEQEMLARCKEAYIAGVDTLAEYSDNKSSAKAKIERLQNQLAELHEPEKIDGTAFAAKHREALQILDDPAVPGDEKSRVIRTFVDHIVFYRSTKSFKIIYKA